MSSAIEPGAWAPSTSTGTPRAWHSATMAATGILYVDVVAVVIGEVLGGWLSAIAHVPV